MKDIKFIEFLWIWNSYVQTFGTPKHHKKMANWLSDLWQGKDDKANKQGTLLAFRNSGKSTIVGLFCAWVLLRKPQTRILVIAADHELSKKMVSNVKRIIERHPLTEHLKPNNPEQWAQEQFTINRDMELRDPSMLAKGISANITGTRADIIICDDVEVPNTCNTPAKREDLRTKLNELDFVLVPDGMSLYIGTPHTYHSIYKETGNHGEKPFLKGFSRLEISIYDKNYNSQWPERFSIEMIESIKQRSGPNKFASQMMLTPVDIADGRLNPEDMKLYNEELQFIEGNGHCELRLCGRKLVSASCWWDPAYGSLDKGDSSVIACVFTDENGEYWLHRIKYITTSPNSNDDEATQQCKIVADFAKEYSLPSIRIETNGIGKFLPGLLRKEISRTDFYCPVIEEHSNKPKHLRIIEAFDAPLAAGVLNCHGSVYCSDFVAEMQEWQPIKTNSKDDGLDAVAGCLSSEPVRLPRFSQNMQTRTKQWKNNNNLKASLDFNV